MRVLIRALVAALLLAVLAVLGSVTLLLWLVPSQSPTVEHTEQLAVADVERALQLVRQHDPRRAIPGVVRHLRLSQHEAELLINQAAARIRPGRWRLDIGADRVQLSGSVPLPEGRLARFGRWLNIEAEARSPGALPQLTSLRVGRLPVPVPLLGWAVDAVAWSQGLASWRSWELVQVQRVRLSPQRLELVYAWSTDAPSKVVAAILSASEHERLRLYAAHLAQVHATLPPYQPVSLSQLLPPMFELAKKRSADGHDPALENRAALLVLGMVANGVSLATLLPERKQELAGRPIRLTLAGRRDFPQHLLISATLAAESGSPLADIIGLYKELSDARSGSGFSFNDMAANRAGTRLGELAVGQAAALQQRLAEPLLEEDLLPDVSGLPEFLGEAEFRRRYGGPGSPEFQRLMSDIDSRLDATPLLRPGTR